MNEAFAGQPAEYDPYLEQQAINAYHQIQQQPFYQTAYTAATDRWADAVHFIGDEFGYGWLLFAALIGAPFTVMAVLRKLGIIKKNG